MMHPSATTVANQTSYSTNSPTMNTSATSTTKSNMFGSLTKYLGTLVRDQFETLAHELVFEGKLSDWFEDMFISRTEDLVVDTGKEVPNG